MGFPMSLFYILNLKNHTSTNIIIMDLKLVSRNGLEDIAKNSNHIFLFALEHVPLIVTLLGEIVPTKIKK